MRPTQVYVDKCREIAGVIASQSKAIEMAASWFAGSILQGRMVHVFGSGHSRIMVEEMWPRYGSFPGFNPIVELSLTFHNLVVGANGQRQAMFLENVSGLAEKIQRNFALESVDSALIISSSGCTIVPIEMAQQFQEKGIKVVAIVSKDHAEGSKSNHPMGKKLADFADLVLDTGAPLGDAMVTLEGLQSPVSPGSTVGGAMLINCLKAETAALLLKEGFTPKVLTSSAILGDKEARKLFETAYDEHGMRMSKLYQQKP